MGPPCGLSCLFPPTGITSDIHIVIHCLLQQRKQKVEAKYLGEGAGKGAYMWFSWLYVKAKYQDVD